ncbi:hypothetical protein MVEN_02450000 [Mycena venus]|uniref:Uncharacterized protein n=1 Tax=Mycena venus TaxID=2733690 RepID=A0A8H6WYM2_9AGAR|nr:hypothetical protein MVEN_02450000 [Mycena venus]
MAFTRPPQHPVAYSHGYPTPPSHPSALSPVVEAQQQQLMLANSQHSTMTPPSRGGALPPDGQSSFRPNLDTLPSAYPTPPAHQSALLSPNAPGANNFHAAMFGRLDTHARHPSVSGSQLLTPIELRPSQLQLAHSSTTPQVSWAPHQQRSSQPGPSTVPRPLQPSHVSVSHPPPRQLSASVSNSAAYGAPNQLRPSFVMPAPPNMPMNPPVQAHNFQGSFTAPSASRSSPQLPTPPDARAPPYLPAPSGSSHPLSHLPTPTNAPLPHSSTLTTSQPPPDTPLRAVLESAWAEYTKKLEGEVKSLTARKEEADAQNAQLTTEREGMRRTIRELLKTVESQREQLRGAAEVFTTRAKQAAEMETRLRNERDESRGQCDKLQKERDELSRQCSASETKLVQSAQERSVEQADHQNALAALNLHNSEIKGIATALSQQLSAYRQEAESLRQERNELRARIESSTQSAMLVDPEPKASIKSEPDLAPKSELKSELLDELELQYPPEPAAPEEPIASTSATAIIPPLSSVPSAADASASSESSTFYTWDLPPDLKQEQKQEQEDRKRSRAEYDADGDATDGDTRGAARRRLQSSPAPTLGPKFPEMQFPELRPVDVKALNSPVRFFMEVRRKQQGG